MAWATEGGWSAGTSPVWTPLNLPGILAWYKADTGVYADTAGTTLATDGGKVARWNDQKTNYHLTNSDTAHQPTYQATGWSGKPCLYYSVANAQILWASGIAIGTGIPYSAFAVCQMESATQANGRILSYAPSSGVQDYGAGGCIFLSRDATNNNIASYRNGIYPTVAVSLATNMRIGMISDGVNVTPYVNNVAGTAVTDTQTFVSGGSLGSGSTLWGAGEPGLEDYWQGKVAEIIFANAAFSSGDRATLDAYFTSNWG